MQINIKSDVKGYTIIELLIVLALFSMILSMAMPNIGLFNRLKEQQELREFKRDILFTRNKAITEAKRHSLYLNYDDNSYFIKRNDTEIIKEHKFQYGLALIKNPNRNEIAFTASGTTGTADTFYIKDSKGSKYKITIGVNTGKVNLTLDN